MPRMPQQALLKNARSGLTMLQIHNFSVEDSCNFFSNILDGRLLARVGALTI